MCGTGRLTPSLAALAAQVAALADCVERFEGGVVLVSHDQYFVGRVAKEVWVVDGGAVVQAPSFEEYRKRQLAKLK